MLKDCTLENVAYGSNSLFLLHNNFVSEDYPAHWHNAVEIIMPVQNTYEVTVKNYTYAMKEFDILLIPSCEAHTLCAPKSFGQRIILQFDLTVLNIVKNLFDSAYIFPKPIFITSDSAPVLHSKIKQRLFEMLDENLRKDACFELSVLSKIIDLAVQITRELNPNEIFDTDRENTIKRGDCKKKFNKCIDHIREHYKDNLTLDSVARAIGFSKYHFSRWFKQMSNMSFIDYLTQVRINKAEVMLLNREMSIAEIAAESGFQSIATFNRIFKEATKRTPTEYRNYNFMSADKKNTEECQACNAADIASQNDRLIFSPVTMQFKEAYMPGSPTVIGEGLVANPFLLTDISNPDVIRVGSVYYMTSTTTHFSPGCPVMKSYDLINWEIVNYVYDILDDSDYSTFRNGKNSYGKGAYASSFRFHNGEFYVAITSYNADSTYIFKTDDIENGNWMRHTLDGVYHDISLLFDDGGRTYMVYGSSSVFVIELTPNATAIKPDGLNKVIIEKTDGASGSLPVEGAHIYKLNGKYYIFLAALSPQDRGRRIELCYRSDSIDGIYEGKALLDDDLGFKEAGVARGVIIDTPNGEWYSMLFQDHKAVGRVPVLVPVTWQDEWPVFGVNRTVPQQMNIPEKYSGKNIFTSDEFYQGSFKNYESVNESGYKYQNIDMEGLSNHDVEVQSNEELIKNQAYESGCMHWSFTDIANISVIEDESNRKIMHVTGRSTTGAGLKQALSGGVKRGGVYAVSAEIKYEKGPKTKVFNISIRNGVSWDGIMIMGTGIIERGIWGTIKGTFTLPHEANIPEPAVFIETVWVDKPKKDIDLMDFYVGRVSVVSKYFSKPSKTMPGENDYNGSNLALAWQWNHNPDNRYWSLTENPGYLRLIAGNISQCLLDSRNTLTQRTFGPECSGTTAVEVAGMNDGDFAGLAALKDDYGYVGVKMTNGKKYIVAVDTLSGRTLENETLPLTQDRIYLKIDFDYRDDADVAYFYYSLDEMHWTPIGKPHQIKYKPTNFVGCRFALFYYATQMTGGYVDFDYFRLTDTLTDSKSLTVLRASLGGAQTVLGVKGGEFKIPISMEALPYDSCEGIYISISVPVPLEVVNVLFCHKNINGITSFTYSNRRLQLFVTGESVAFSNENSDLFAVIEFKVDEFVTDNMTVRLRPDYIYVKGGDAFYGAHNAQAVISIKKPDTGALAKIPGCSNPLISHRFGADPCAIVYSGRVYLYMTSDYCKYDVRGKLVDNDCGKINTISVISSSDFVNWTDHGEIAVAGTLGAAKWAKCSWAPSVVYKTIDGKDKFFLYFADSANNIGVIFSESPLGPWFDPIGKPLVNKETPGAEKVVWCFDPAALVDSDGTGYLYFGGGLPSEDIHDALHPKTSRVIRLGNDMISTVGKAELIDAPAFLSDSWINKYNDLYYYSYCSNYSISPQSGYPHNGEIAYMVSRHPMGPFKYVGTVMKNPYQFFGVGGSSHHCIFTWQGMWYVAYHTQTVGKAIGKVRGHRSPHINKLTFSGDGRILPVAADMKGVSIHAVINPYEWNDAETIAWSAGIVVEKRPETGGVLTEVSKEAPKMQVTDIHDGDWLAVANVDFGETGASKFNACVASIVGGEIKIKLDSPAGMTVGVLGTGSTGSENNWSLKSCEVIKVTGIHHVFFMFNGDSNKNLFNFDSWSFDRC